MTISDRAIAAMQLPSDAPASAWAARINACWRETAESIIETGRLLNEAKEALEHGQWGDMVSALDFDERTSQRLMSIGRDERLSNPAILPLLPAQWTKIHKLHKLDTPSLERALREAMPVNGARAIMGSRQEPDDSLDYFPTPPWATRALAQHVLPAAGLAGKRFGIAWEPACGEGHIAEPLAKYSDKVIATDVFDYGYGELQDFLEVGLKPPQCDWLVTNPPFGDKGLEFVVRSLSMLKHGVISTGVAMFFRSQWAVEGIERYEEIFRDRPPTLCAFFVERVNLCKGRWDPEGSTATAYCWLVWIKGAQPRPPFWIPPGCRESLTHPDDAERFTAHPVIRRKRESINPETGEVTEAA
jgi:hypothetical protein